MMRFILFWYVLCLFARLFVPDVLCVALETVQLLLDTLRLKGRGSTNVFLILKGRHPPSNIFWFKQFSRMLAKFTIKAKDAMAPPGESQPR